MTTKLIIITPDYFTELHVFTFRVNGVIIKVYLKVFGKKKLSTIRQK